MIANVYKLRISDGIISQIHGCFTTITEYFIPAGVYVNMGRGNPMGISLNIVNGEIHCFKTYEGRYKNASLIENVDIPQELVDKLVEYLRVKDEMEYAVKEWEKSEKST